VSYFHYEFIDERVFNKFIIIKKRVHRHQCDGFFFVEIGENKNRSKYITLVRAEQALKILSTIKFKFINIY